MTEMTPQERAKAKRLYKAYRWTWAMYQALGTLQGWKCAICGRIATGGHSTLNLDHEHFKIYTRRLTLLDADDATIILGGLNLRWLAGTTVQGQVLVRYAKTKTAAIASLKEDALPLSVRGLLCPGRDGKAGHGCCNRLLGRVDNPDWLEKARNYLLNPPAKSLDFTPPPVV